MSTASRRWFVVGLACLAATAWADKDPDDKPFAEARILLQLSEAGRESTVLDVANNLIRHYGGPDMVDIEIVTIGQGIKLMSTDSPYRARVTSLSKSGVRFYVCENTLDTMERNTGIRPEVDENALLVPSGFAYIVHRIKEHDFVAVRP